jgi:hypothetical protein
VKGNKKKNWSKFNIQGLDLIRPIRPEIDSVNDEQKGEKEKKGRPLEVNSAFEV